MENAVCITYVDFVYIGGNGFLILGHAVLPRGGYANIIMGQPYFLFPSFLFIVELMSILNRCYLTN